MKKKLTSKTLVAVISIFYSFLSAQTLIKGTVQNDKKEKIKGAQINVEEIGMETSTDAHGKYEITLPNGKYKFIITTPDHDEISEIIPINNEKQKIVDFTIKTFTIENVVVTGTRSKPRTLLESPTPVDIIDVKKIAENGAQVSVNQILNYVAPSFTSTTQSLGGGTDMTDPISLRGLTPDQVLVLVNGKRRYNSALLNVNGTFGKGTVGTDLNSIPVSSIDRIEILRDAAAAQYGSDAVAGVINIILKTSINRFSALITGGEYISKNSAQGKTSKDGEAVQVGLNYGIPLSEKGGYINFSATFDRRNPTNRGGMYQGSIYKEYTSGVPVDKTDEFLETTHTNRRDYSLIIGQSKALNGQVAYNASLPLNTQTEVYSFGIFGYRNSTASQFYRYPNSENNVPSIYPLGFRPQAEVSIYDKSATLGIKGMFIGWKMEVSNTFGQNTFTNKAKNTLNASLGELSPTSFRGGKLQFTQNVVNVDMSKKFNWLSEVGIAWGGEYRYERYQIIAGEEASYDNYAMGREIDNPDGSISLVPDINGTIPMKFGPDGKTPIPGGAQGNAGFSPQNATDSQRNSLAAYTDVEINFNQSFLVDLAGRYEYYNDFGSTVNGKIALRYKISNSFNFRGSGSTGFRAPSLQQRYYSSTGTSYVNGNMYEVGTFTNDSKVAQLLGIPKLKPEKSRSLSAGLSAKVGRFHFSLDGYFTRINDKIVYTDLFSGDPNGSSSEKEIYQILQQAGAQKARFFANAVDTETKGIDAVLSYNTLLGNGKLFINLAGTISYTQQVGSIHTSRLLKDKKDIYFSNSSKVYLENVIPNQKFNISLTYAIQKLNLFLRNNYFGGVTEPSNILSNQQYYNPRWITDASIAYKLTDFLKLTVGANNLFNCYPEKVAKKANSNQGQFVYSRYVSQFGFNGRYIFTRLNFNL
ncbi:MULTISPECIES: TonB-dependent receptor [unclassified Apibacter]|uniref:TonB-dependent receptor n=1 Tax=unclassified Apibacter TaxID=2630820 RepID=UPI001323A5C9|nr:MULTISPECIES: TonB-dependent receptor [unclassified Apibacter]MCX8676190.1 TonB-dependent receptor [Apibacter sp. B3919]MXO25266.1 TonB-dependent receptor [Apibacter sp. B3924]MXO26660.1 TonB-dependent receptor [Apibacter sp. B3813]MXO29389.1 TonB-dependent receptor [Apibacter sp. B3913]MXO30938.1 TonB-dependent receptor [Apibacter sp. B3912]